MIRTFSDALRFLDAATDYERMASRYAPEDYDLDRMRRLLASAGNPERAFLSLHIAGTKGKGSTAHFAESLLRAAGKRTGLYTSPHLVDLRERIRLDGEPVGGAEFARALAALEAPMRRLKPTFFEIMTAAAFRIFARRRVDWAVVEVGIGGRLDATNVIRPAACAITTIDYDHMDKLGNTLTKIAREKAGILKPGVPAVSSPQPPEARRALGAFPGLDFPGFRILRGPRGVVHFRTAQAETCRLAVRGAHQAANAATALALVERGGLRLTAAARARGLRRARLPGRVELLPGRPRVLVDAAHNPVSARALKEALREVPHRRLLLVFGASADKDYGTMLRILAPLADRIFLTRAAGPRAAAPSDLARRLKGRGCLTIGGVAPALRLARKQARPEDLVLVTGSFYVAGEALKILRGRA